MYRTLKTTEEIWRERIEECRSDRERDEVTNYWLQCNDPYYSDTDPKKIDKIEYPYLTANKTRTIHRKEFPESSINVKGTLELKKKGMAENKEFER